MPFKAISFASLFFAKLVFTCRQRALTFLGYNYPSGEKNPLRRYSEDSQKIIILSSLLLGLKSLEALTLKYALAVTY